MRAGELVHVVDLQRRTIAKSESGAAKPSAWTTFRTCRANIEPLSGRELTLARQVEARVTHKVTLRHDPLSSLLTSDRIAFRNGGRVRVFGILSVTNTEEGDRELVASCVEDTTATGA